MAADLLGQQDELLKQLERSLTNFKKTPKDRWSKAYVQVKLKLLDEKWTKFMENHMTLINEEGIEDDDYTKEDYYSRGEEMYTLAKCEMLEKQEKLGALEYSTPNASPSTSVLQQPMSSVDIKLPGISLPSFSGNYSDWLPFHDMFYSLIHQNQSLKDVQKLHYLKSSLTGEAEALLRHIPVTDVNYNDAWTVLNKRYNNKRFLVNSILKRLTSQRVISTVRSNTIKLLLDTTNECLSTLKNMGITAFEWDTLLVHLTVEKLDSESVKLWEQHVSSSGNNGDEIPTYKQLCSFLESRFRTLEVLESSKHTPRSNAQTSFHTVFNTTCKFCNGSHSIDSCKDFAQLVYAERKSFIERNGICFNCLIPFHLAVRCRKRPLCRLCGRKHHSLLHPEEDPQKKIPEDGSGNNDDREILEQEDVKKLNNSDNNYIASHYTDKRRTNVLLATAVVKVNSKRGEPTYLRALIDQGSQGSFITESAVQALGLKKFPSNCTINGLGESGSLSSKSTVIFNAYSIYNSNFCTPVNAYVLTSLTRILPTREVECSENWTHLHQLKLADPNYHKPGRVDLLLGADVYGDIIREGLKKGPHGSPTAQNTRLGWILSGQLLHNKESPQNYTITLSMHASIEDDDVLQKFWESESDTTNERVLSEEETQCEEHCAKTHTRDKDGRYIVCLPFKEINPSCQYGSSRDVAERRLLQLERKLAKDEHLKEQYTKVLHEYLELGHMEEIEIKHEVPTDLIVNAPLEEKRTINVLNTIMIKDVNDFTEIFERFSTLERLLRVIARCKRFRYTNKRFLPEYLTSEELEEALLTCIKLCQREEFAEEIVCINGNRALKKKSKLRSLTPYLDDRGILRVGGRLRYANIPEDAKHQILLPDSNAFTRLIVAQAHKKTLHGGPTLMLNYIRQRFWILGGKTMIKQVVHRCVICVRHRAATRTQLMADLPKQRVSPTRPFTNTGIDFAGPIDIKMSKGRGCKTYKGYICIFICMANRAIHIEIVSSLESESFVAAFKRFTARRGHCSDIWSDNATNFTAGNKLLREMYKGQLKTVNTEILDQLARDGTTWHYIPAAAPHFGGLWEAGVRSIKHHLKRTLGNSMLNYEELSTATSQIEACLNSRPISQISDNVDDLLPLTPGHFLIGEPPIIVPEKSYLDANMNRLNRWQLVQRMTQHIWDRWSKEYLSRLQQRPKWVNRVNNDIKIGMLVLVKDDNLPPGKWSLARILDIHPGNDGLIRVVTLKLKNSVTKRPITKICLLPVDA